MSIVTLLTIVYLNEFLDCTAQEFVVRPTTKGNVQGYTIPFYETPDTHVLDVFTGIPYARPPVGELRWLHPEEAESWEGVYDATRHSPCCPQVLDNIRGWSLGPDYDNSDEDCLYLNIYAPRNLVEQDDPHAVMVWIHGGSYRYGSGEEYDARVLAQQGVVVVTVNYRLGVLAMMSTDDELAPGNCGLMDCVLALRWIQENIENFGGDPSRVTVFGNSAGGASVSLLMFSELTEGLIHRVIAQSGDALSPWSIYRPPFLHKPKAEELARSVDCPTDSADDMLNCLKEIDAQTLVEASVSGTEFNAAWAPRIDGTFIKNSPEELLKNGDFLKVDYLSGTVPDEYSGEYYGSDAGWNRTVKEEQMHTWTRRFLQRDQPADLLLLALLHEYDEPRDDYQAQRDLFLEMRADDSYIAPHDKHAVAHADVVNNTFMYTFTYRSDGDQQPEWIGVPHFSESFYVFGTPLWDSNAPCPWGCQNVVWENLQEWSEIDKQVARNVMEAWTNFAKTGNPSTSSINWPPFHRTTKFYMELDSRFTEKQFYKYNRVDFVNRYRESLFESETCSN